MSGKSVREAALRLSLVDQVTDRAKIISNSLKKLDGALQRFNQRSEAANAAFRSSIFEAGVFAAALSQPIRAAARLEDAMADVRKVSGLGDEELQKFRNQIIQLSRETPMAAEELAGLAAELAAAGVPDSDLLEMTKLVSRVGVAFNITGEEAGENLGKIRAALGMSTAELTAFADQVNALSDATASQAPDLLDFMKRMGALGKQYGFTSDQVLAFGSAMISAGATSETAATGFQAVGRALIKGTAATKGQITAFDRLGLTSEDVAKGMAKDALGTVEDVFRRIRELPDHERGAIVNMLFGDEAKTAVALIENTNLLAGSLKVLADQGLVSGSVLREFNTRIGTTSGKMKMLRNRVMAAGIAFGNALLPSVGKTADALGPLADQASRFIETNQEMVARLTKVSAGMIAARVAMAGLRAGAYALLRPSNLLVAVLGYLAYQNFDTLAASLQSLKALATDLAGTAFAKEFLSGAGEAMKAVGDGARKLVDALREMSAEGGAVRAWLDSVDGAGWGKTLGKLAIGLGAVGAAAGALAAVAGPVRAVANAVLLLSGVRPAWALLRFLRGLGRSTAAVKATGAALSRLADDAASAGTRAGKSFGTSLASAARGVITRAGLGAILAAEIIGSIPDTAEGVQEMIRRNRKRSESWNEWLEKNVGTPRTWLFGEGEKRPAPAASGDEKKAGDLRSQLDQMTSEWPMAAQRALKSYGNALAQGGAQAETEAQAIGQRVEQALTVEGKPTVNTADIQRALSLARQLAAALRAPAGGGYSSPTNTNKFGGPRARGGPVKRGVTYLVGEQGPEPFTAPASGYITSNKDWQEGAAAGNTVHAPITVNLKLVVNGASAADLNKLAEDAARRVVGAVTSSLERKLSRGPEIAFSGAKPWGDF